MKRAAVLLLLSLALVLPLFEGSANSAETGAESIEAVEKDLVTILKEMESLQAELDRLEDLAAFPKTTGIRIEIHRDGAVPAPVRGKILVQGKVEEERDWTMGERDAFAGTIPVPIVFQMPYLPGTYNVRFELYHPSWKEPPAVVFETTIRKGEIIPFRLRLSSPAGKTVPALSPIKGK